MACVGFFSCDPNEKLPPEIILEWVGYQLFADSTGLVGVNLQVSFQNGDGKIGHRGDSLFVEVFDKVSLTDTIFVPMQTLQVPESEDWVISFVIPSSVNPNPGSSVKGMFDILFDSDPGNFDVLRQQSKHGFVRFEIYLLDQDLVRSYIKTLDGKMVQGNVVTPEIRIR
jgi:hypothetical protein